MRILLTFWGKLRNYSLMSSNKHVKYGIWVFFLALGLAYGLSSDWEHFGKVFVLALIGLGGVFQWIDLKKWENSEIKRLTSGENEKIQNSHS